MHGKCVLLVYTFVLNLTCTQYIIICVIDITLCNLWQMHGCFCEFINFTSYLKNILYCNFWWTRPDCKAFEFFQFCFCFVSGIMTLTRTPCELDRMSLFQDLKLKRRKVDSRCSSDGKFDAYQPTSKKVLIFFFHTCLQQIS